MSGSDVGYLYLPITAGEKLDTASNFIFSITYVMGTLRVTRADQTIAWNNPADIDFGTPLGPAQLDAVVSTSGPAAGGGLSYSQAPGTLLQAGAAQTLTVNASATQDYNQATATVMIDVLKATVTLTWINPADIASGTALGSAQLDATSSVPGTYTYTPAAGTVLALSRGQGRRPCIRDDFTCRPTPTNYTALPRPQRPSRISCSGGPGLAPPPPHGLCPKSIRYGPRRSLTALTVDYNEPLNSGSAGASGLYQVLGAVIKIVKKHKMPVFSKPLAIRSVIVNGNGDTVTVNLSKPYKGAVQVSVQGAITATNSSSSNLRFTEIVG